LLERLSIFLAALTLFGPWRRERSVGGFEPSHEVSGEMISKAEKSPLEKYPVWDLAVRLNHWALVAVFLLSWWSAEYDYQDVHILSGYIILALVLVRLYWGFIGSTTARFGSFVRGPRAIFSYAGDVLKRPGVASVGHNPMGALSVIVMLGLLFFQPILGLFSRDIDGLHSGPLSHLVGYSAGRLVADLHHLVFDLLLIFVALHLMAIAFYIFYKRDNIVSAMVSGTKFLPRGSRDKLNFVPVRRALLAFVVAAGFLGVLHYFGS
jgi:cytochrome b